MAVAPKASFKDVRLSGSTDTPIFSTHERPKDLNVTYFGSEVTDPRVPRVRFKNTGKQIIDATDFLEDYEIRRGDAQILDQAIVDQSEPGSELASITELGAGQPQYIKFKPKTLNPGDWFTVQLFYDGGASEMLTVTGRIKGQTRRSAIYPSRAELRETTELFIWTAGAYGTVLVLLGALLFVINPSPASHRVGLITVGAGIVAVMLGVVLSFRSRRRLYARLQAGTQVTEPD